MSKIDDLIAQHCPNGAEFMTVGNICEIANNKRKPVKSSLRILGKTPYYGANNIQDYVDGFTHDGNYILVAEDGSASLDNNSIQYTKGKFWANNHIHVIKSANGLVNRFLFHYLRSMDFRPFLSGGERSKLTKTQIIQIQIPIPPLPVQQEIVKILDTFT
jgi:type I restriction enzyme S subunit